MKKLLKQKQHKVHNKITLISVYKKTYVELVTFWRPISLIIIVFAGLYALLILGLSIVPSLQDLQDQVDTYAGDSASNFVKAFTLVAVSVTSGDQSDATSMLQFLLFIIASLALVFTFRKLQQLKKVKITEAYYQGNANIIPVILVTIMLILCLIPLGIGGVVVATSLQFYAGGIELIIISLIAGLLLLLSVYLLAMWWPAFYIASLPGTKPFSAMRAARSITKGQRFKFLGVVSFSVLILFIVFFSVLIPLAMLIPIIVPATAYLLLLSFFAIGHALLFTMYRALIDEPKK